MQTNFSINPPIGLPGMRFDNGPHEVRAFPAKVAIPFGVLCEFTTLADGVTRAVQPVQDAGTAGSFLPNLAGISEYDAMREQGYAAGGTIGQGYYKAGEMVPCVRRGRMFVAFSGSGTWPEYAAVRVQHNSDGSSGAGVFTMAAASTTLHAEIDTAPSCLGIESALVQNGTDFSGDSLVAAVVSINLGP